MTPTKADPLYDRMVHAFGKQRIADCLLGMMSAAGRNILDVLTDEARDELLRRCIASHKRTRKFSAESRRRYAERRAS